MATLSELQRGVETFGHLVNLEFKGDKLYDPKGQVIAAVITSGQQDARQCYIAMWKRDQELSWKIKRCLCRADEYEYPAFL